MTSVEVRLSGIRACPQFADKLDFSEVNLTGLTRNIQPVRV